MEFKTNSKSNNRTIKERQDKNKNNVNNKRTKEKNFSKYIHPYIAKTSKKKTNFHSKDNKKISIKPNLNNKLKNEDSSTNCLSGNNNKRINDNPKYNVDLINSPEKENFIIPILINKESDTESLFINYQLAQNDSNSESILRSDLENYNLNNLKKNNNDKNKYNHCYVDDNIGNNENDSLELYDFADKKNVDYVLRNLSALSISKSNKDKSSINLDNCNEEEFGGKKKFINAIKIFNVKNSLLKFSPKIKGDNYYNNKLMI